MFRKLKSVVVFLKIIGSVLSGRYTWRRKKPDIQCRLDFFLTSQSLISKINTWDIVPGYKTDHSMITMAIVTNSNPRDPGFWKLNTPFQSEDNYVTKIKKYDTRNKK